MTLPATDAQIAEIRERHRRAAAAFPNNERLHAQCSREFIAALLARIEADAAERKRLEEALRWIGAADYRTSLSTSKGF